MKFPEPYDFDAYCAWYKATYPDGELEQQVNEQRSKLKVEAQDDLTALAKIFEYVFTFARGEYQAETQTSVKFETNLTAAVCAPSSSTYDFLFKPTESIIEKMWRKHASGVEFKVDTMSAHIHDLIRTEVVSSTLTTGRFLMKYFRNLKDHIHTKDLRKLYEAKIKSMYAESEMKMASGYFAYHVQVYFHSGLEAEVQIQSVLGREWRNLSHQLFERVRVEGSVNHEFGAKETRLVSLGHLLHLAECEIERLVAEFSEASK